MQVKLKPIEQQIIVITGASSGIGRATALMASHHGARVVCVARNETALKDVVTEIRDTGGDAVYALADVAVPAELDEAARVAIANFGGFDTWVNDAGIGLYGRLDEIPLEEKRRLFDVTFWGIVYGSRSALPHLRKRGGAIINLGSVESDVALPLTGIYAAAKHAVKAYTDVLRMELEHDDVPVSVTLIKPTGTDRPLFQHARNHLEVEPKRAPAVYAPDVVAEAILHAASHPTRELFVGGSARALTSRRTSAPAFGEKFLDGTQLGGETAERPAPRYADILYDAPHDEESVQGDDGHEVRSSVYTRARVHPVLSTAVLAGVGLAVAAGVRRLTSWRGD